MKLSKSLLQAIAVGLAVGAVTPACSLLENDDLTIQEKKAQEGENLEECYTEEGTKVYDCPACGMG